MIQNSEIFIQHLKKYGHIEPQQISGILSFFKRTRYRKKESLMTAGQICQEHFFVESGCLRMYFVDEKGVEHTTQFAIESWWMTDHLSFLNQSGTGFYIQAVEKTIVLSLNVNRQNELLARYPEMEKYFRIIYQRAYAASQMKEMYLQDFSREELFNHFYDNFPEFVQRVPQYMLASYLGITPEYLSEIRNKKRS